MTPVVVHWDDAFGDHTDDADLNDESPHVVQTCGWLRKTSERYLWIASEQTPNGDRCVTRIPRALILKIEEV